MGTRLRALLAEIARAAENPGKHEMRSGLAELRHLAQGRQTPLRA